MSNKKIKNASKLTVNGITFKSKLEVNVYNTLKAQGFQVEYEPKTFIIWEGFRPTVPFYDRSGKGDCLLLQKNKIIDIRYTPDFIVGYKGFTIFIEAKGMENDVFYIKKKLFRSLLEEMNDVMYFEVRSKKETLEAVKIIKKYVDEHSRTN